MRTAACHSIHTVHTVKLEKGTPLFILHCPYYFLHLSSFFSFFLPFYCTIAVCMLTVDKQQRPACDQRSDCDDAVRGGLCACDRELTGCLRCRRTWRTLAVVSAVGVGALVGSQVVESRRVGPPPGERKKLVIVGSGWSAVALLKGAIRLMVARGPGSHFSRLVRLGPPGLQRDLYDVTVVSNRNYFLFTPLLPSATVGALDVAALIEPVRRICSRVSGTFAQAAVVDVDDKAKQVVCRDKHGNDFRIPYDMLVVRHTQ